MTDTSTRDMLIALLRDMTDEEPDEIDLSEMDNTIKPSMVVGCCCAIIASCIRAIAKDHEEAQAGVKAVAADISNQIKEGPYGHERSH